MKILKYLLIFLNIYSSSYALTITESFNLKIIQEVRISPDGKTALVVINEVDQSLDSSFYNPQIYFSNLKENSEIKQLVPQFSTSFRPRWSPDGKKVAFLSYYQNQHALYIYDMLSKNVGLAFEPTSPIQNFCWAPDSTKIAFVTAKCFLKEQSVISNETKMNQLCIFDLLKSKSAPQICTSDDFCVRGVGDFNLGTEEYSWAPDGKNIVFAYSPSCKTDDCYLDSRLAIFDCENHAVKPISRKVPYEATPIYSPNGQWIAYLSSELPDYALNKRINVISRDGTVHKLLPPTFNQGADLKQCSLLGWTKDSQQLIFFEPHRTKYKLFFVSIEHEKIREFVIPNWTIHHPCLNESKDYLGFVAEKSDYPQEAYYTSLCAFTPHQITTVNRSLSLISLAKTEIMTWKSDDGLLIEGLLSYPTNYQRGMRYPLILMIHGGPMYFFDETFIGNPNFYSAQLLAQKGFFVLQPNPRGSTGYGKSFRCANYGDWGGKDAEDLMSGINALIQKGVVDEKRLGVMGWSYGGFMTAYLIAHSSRFKAAVMGASICNLVSFAGTTDLERFTSSYLGEFWKNPELYQHRSPIYYAYQVKTPCLILHGEKDVRVPLSQSMEFYRVLNRNRQTVKLVVLPGMGHGFSQPNNSKKIMQETQEWFENHLTL